MREVRRLRQEKGWNQTELAFYAGLAPSVISQIETGKRDPSAATLRKLATALGVDVPDLFERSEGLKAQAPLPLEGPQEETAAERRYLVALLEMLTYQMETLASSYHERIASLREDWPYERSLRNLQWVYAFLQFGELLEGEPYTKHFIELVDPWVTRVERSEPVPEEIRQRVLAFTQAFTTLFGEVVPAARRWVRKQKERFPNDRDLAQISTDVLVEERTAEEAKASRSVPEARTSRVRQ